LTVWGLARVIGVGIILLIGFYGGLLSRVGGLDVLIVFQIINTSLMFVIMTVAYEWLRRSTA